MIIKNHAFWLVEKLGLWGCNHPARGYHSTARLGHASFVIQANKNGRQLLNEGPPFNSWILITKMQAKLPLQSSTIKQRYQIIFFTYCCSLYCVNWHVILFAIDVLNYRKLVCIYSSDHLYRAFSLFLSLLWVLDNHLWNKTSPPAEW